MNIYRITEDGEAFCIKAKTMHEAVKVCEDSYVEEELDSISNKKFSSETIDSVSREYYNTNLLQSCELIGELKN